jgi:membrane-associated protease RseP (regulator of RpoE activity)
MHAMRSAILSLLIFSGCVYAHRGTSLSVVHGETRSMSAPENICSLTIVGANITPRKPGNLSWDDGEGLPDTFVKIFRNNVLVHATSERPDSLSPEWNETLPRNLSVPTDSELRFEVWDSDTIGADPVGIYSHRGLPDTAVEDNDARLMLENGSFLTVRVGLPIAHRGVGIPEYELRPDGLVVVRIEPNSPASRADIVPGDRIVAIGGRRLAQLDDATKASAISMAHSRSEALEIVGADGRTRNVRLDDGFVWLTM